MLKTIRKHGITLALFAAGSTGLTAAINQMTKTTIAEQASLQQEALFDQVLPAERYNNALAQSCYLVTAPELGTVLRHRLMLINQLFHLLLQIDGIIVGVTRRRYSALLNPPNGVTPNPV